MRALLKVGFVLRRQKGSHAILVHAENPARRAIIPIHGSQTIKPGTLGSILKGADVTPDDLKDLL